LLKEGLFQPKEGKFKKKNQKKVNSKKNQKKVERFSKCAIWKLKTVFEMVDASTLCFNSVSLGRYLAIGRSWV
jgi:hypothetical protein